MSRTAQDLFHQRESLLHAYKAKVHELKSKYGEQKEMVYPNQLQAAAEIINELFEKDKIVATLIALPQVGKTGTFLEAAYRACTHPDDSKIIDPRNVFMITGMSDKDWQKQTEGDMLEAFRRRVYHRGKLNTTDREDGFYTNLSLAKNALIILDECHIGAEKEHQISKMLRRIGLLNIDTLRERNIKIIEVSATPGATLRDTESWGPTNQSTVILKESEKYVGFRDFIREERLHPSYDLTDESELEKLITFIKTTFPRPRWHIIRLPAKSRKNGEFGQRLSQICARESWNIQHHSSNDRMGEIDHHMSTEPKQHCILLIKEFWRAGKRLEDSFMGIVHEPLTTTKDTNVTAQGLVGRLCGNDKHASAHMFCDMDRIKEYLAWIDAKGDFSKIKEYNSRTLTIKKGAVTSSRDTFAHASNMVGVAAAPKKAPDYELSTPTFCTAEAALEWGNTAINWMHPDLVSYKQTVAWKVTPHGKDGVDSVGNTHYSYKGSIHPIQTLEKEEKSADKYGRFGQGVRCIPVVTTTGIQYKLVYKIKWKPSASPSS